MKKLSTKGLLLGLALLLLAAASTLLVYKLRTECGHCTAEATKTQ